MKRTDAITLALALIVAAFAAAPGAYAKVAKGPIGLGADPTTGIVSPDGEHRYITTQTRDGTLVQRLETDGGKVDRLNIHSRSLVVPAVAFDFSPAGLSADGRTLVLSQPSYRFPLTSSRFVAFDAERLNPRPAIKLPGSWSFDAISPDGRTMYLIEYTSPRDLTEYRVRAYDLAERKLDPEPIIDPNESGEDMLGTALTRANGVGGRWAYTLYESAERDHPPFIHALDTKRGTAVCIDLEPLTGNEDLFRLDLQPSLAGDTLSVVDRGEPVAQVDLESFEVTEPSSTAAAIDTAADDGGAPWPAVAAGLALLGLAGSLLALALRRRRRRRVTEAELERLVEGEERGAPRDQERDWDPVR